MTSAGYRKNRTSPKRTESVHGGTKPKMRIPVKPGIQNYHKPRSGRPTCSRTALRSRPGLRPSAASRLSLPTSSFTAFFRTVPEHENTGLRDAHATSIHWRRSFLSLSRLAPPPGVSSEFEEFVGRRPPVTVEYRTVRPRRMRNGGRARRRQQQVYPFRTFVIVYTHGGGALTAVGSGQLSSPKQRPWYLIGKRQCRRSRRPRISRLSGEFFRVIVLRVRVFVIAYGCRLRLNGDNASIDIRRVFVRHANRNVNIGPAPHAPDRFRTTRR